MRDRRLPHIALLTVAVAVGACNMVTGADEIAFTDDDSDSSDGNGGFGATPAVGAGGSVVGNGAGGEVIGANGATNGTTASGVTTSTGNGGAGGAPTTTTTTSTSSTSASTTAATTTTTAASTTAATTSSTSATTGGGGMGCGGSGPTTTPLDSQEQQFLVLINNYRAQNNLGALTACISLNRTAQGHSEDMRDNDYFSHTGLNNSTPWERACDACFDKGCGPMTAMAENIAAGYSDAAATFNQWQTSPGHNANMLNGSFTMLGIGRATGGGTYGVYWTNVFAGSDEPSCY